MTVYKRSDDAAVDKTGDGNVSGLGSEDGDRFISVPIGTDMVALFIQPAAAVAMCQIFRVMILNGHDPVSLSGMTVCWRSRQRLRAMLR